jgi:hypothetical protein
MMHMKALKAAAESATAGPWYASRHASGRHFEIGSPTAGIAIAHSGSADAAFIALANPSAILSLIGRVEQLEGALRPFAAKYDDCRPPVRDIAAGLARDLDGDADEVTALVTFNLGDFRRARAALSNPTETVK